MLTSGAGIVFGLLTIVSWYLMQADRAALAGGLDPADPFPADDFSGSTIAGLYPLPSAGILFLWFIVACEAGFEGRNGGEPRSSPTSSS